MRTDDFFNLYRNNFLRVVVAIPEVRVADPSFNAQQIVRLILDAAEPIVVFPELSCRQKSEDVVGPYELQDFHLYYTLRFGYALPQGGISGLVELA